MSGAIESVSGAYVPVSQPSLRYMTQNPRDSLSQTLTKNCLGIDFLI